MASLASCIPRAPLAFRPQSRRGQGSRCGPIPIPVPFASRPFAHRLPARIAIVVASWPQSSCGPSGILAPIASRAQSRRCPNLIVSKFGPRFNSHHNPSSVVSPLVPRHQCFGWLASRRQGAIALEMQAGKYALFVTTIGGELLPNCAGKVAAQLVGVGASLGAGGLGRMTTHTGGHHVGVCLRLSVPSVDRPPRCPRSSPGVAWRLLVAARDMKFQGRMRPGPGAPGRRHRPACSSLAAPPRSQLAVCGRAAWWGRPWNEGLGRRKRISSRVWVFARGRPSA